jgi:hypothetical protein
MNTSEAQLHPMEGQARGQALANRLGGGLIMESIGAVGVIVLAIVGLAGMAPGDLASIATLVLGAVVLVEGSGLKAAYRQWYAQRGAQWQVAEAGGGVSAEFFGGLAAIVLGILALFRPMQNMLLAVAVLVLGATFLISATALSWLGGPPEPAGAHSARETNPIPTRPEAGGQVLISLAAVVLGILAIIGLQSTTLILVGLLCLGAAALFGGSGMSHREAYEGGK